MHEALQYYNEVLQCYNEALSGQQSSFQLATLNSTDIEKVKSKLTNSPP